MVQNRKMNTYPCKIIPNTVIESAEQLSTDSIIKPLKADLFFYLQIEAELSEITGTVWHGLIPFSQWIFFYLRRNYVEPALLLVV